MRPDDRDLEEEIHTHLALSIQEWIDRGEDPDTARLAVEWERSADPALARRSTCVT